MKKRYILITSTLLLVLLILGSFFDLKISETLYFKDNSFSLVFAIVGEYLTFGGLAFFGGLIFKTAKKYLQNKVWSVLFLAGALIYLFFGGFLFGKELSETDALGGLSSLFTKIYIYAPLGILLVAPMFYVGTIFSIAVNSKNKFASIVSLSFAILFALIVTMGVKELSCRPRYFYIVEYGRQGVVYSDWWQIFKDKETLMAADGVDSNMFKSLPSGHACYSMCGLMVGEAFALLDGKIRKHHVAIFFGIVGFSLVVSFSRILCGRHFLSDVSIGMIIALVSYVIVNMIIKNYFNKPEVSE